VFASVTRRSGPPHPSFATARGGAPPQPAASDCSWRGPANATEVSCDVLLELRLHVFIQPPRLTVVSLAVEPNGPWARVLPGLVLHGFPDELDRCHNPEPRPSGHGFRATWPETATCRAWMPASGATVCAHQRWLLLFQALSCVLRRAAQFNAGRLVTTVVTTIDLGPQIMHPGGSCPHFAGCRGQSTPHSTPLERMPNA